LDCVTGLGKYKGRLIILLDISKILAARELQNVPAEKAAAGGSSNAGVVTVTAGTVTKSAAAGK
jgi:hypothetical protein